MKRSLFLFGFVLWCITASAQWQETNYIETMNVEDLCFITEDVGYVVGYHEVYKTTDGGDSWNLVVANPFQNGPRHVFFVNETVGFIAGSMSGTEDAIQIGKTINGGVSWDFTYLDGNPSTFSYGQDLYFLDENIGFLVCRGGSVYRTIDQGANWVRVHNDANEDFKAIHFPTAAIGYMIPDYGNVIYHTINGGNSWSTIPLGQNYSMNALFFTDAQTGFIALDDTRILRTTDGGQSWTMTDFGSQDEFTAITFTNFNTGYVVGSNGILVTTSNAGATWVPQASGAVQHLTTIQFVNDSVGYIGTNYPPRVFKTTSGGGILSVGDVDEELAATVYPVPSSGLVQVVLKDGIQQTGYRLISMEGKLLQQGVLRGQNTQLDLQELPAGMYMLSLDAHPGRSIRLVLY